jgi:hypothetical protein
MDAIRSQAFALKKAKPIEKKAPEPKEGLGSIMALLARRQAIEGSDSDESSSDSDWD